MVIYVIKGIYEIFKNDIKTVKRNPIAIAVLLVIICVPSLYALVNLQATWDPYSKTSNIGVAVVDDDLGFDYGIHYDLGGTLSDQLKNNADFNWQFVDRETAIEGVKNGKYYAAVIFPDNFSQELFTASDPPTVELMVNDKLGPIAPRITTTGVDAIITSGVDAVQSKIKFSSMDQNGVEEGTVELEKEHVYSTDNYGSTLAPFYIAIALWIGGIMSVAFITIRVKSEKKYQSTSVYLGRMGLFLIITFSQTLITSLGLILILNIQTSSSTLFILTTVFIGLCFMIIAYSLTSTFGNIGKIFVILLLLLQISTTGGTFPPELLSPLFRDVHTYLPFTYAIGALREVISGVLWSNYWYCIEILAVFTISAFILTLLLKGKLNRGTTKTEERLKKTGLFQV